MNKKTPQMPRFKTESEEADWSASKAGRAYVKQKSAGAQSEGTTAGGSRLVAMLNKKSSVQIAIRLRKAISHRPARSPAVKASATRPS